jgi:hypothetical protein
MVDASHLKLIDYGENLFSIIRASDLVISIPFSSPSYIARAIGMTKIAEQTGMSRPSLYKALSEGAKPQFATIMKVLKAIGGQIQVNPLSV